MTTYQRHPISARYPDLTGRAWEEFLSQVKEDGVRRRKIILFENKILDGWQLYRACLELDLKPQFMQLPEGEDPERYVQRVNEHRRHEPLDVMHKRIDERRAQVGKRRKEGASIPTIAAEEGVSETTVRNDLAVSTSQGCEVEPPDGKVTGKDGKKRTSKPRKSKPKDAAPQPCTRCLRMGSPSCPECREAFPEGFPKQAEAGTYAHKPFDWKKVNEALGTLFEQIHSQAVEWDVVDTEEYAAVRDQFLAAKEALSRWKKQLEGGKK